MFGKLSNAFTKVATKLHIAKSPYTKLDDAGSLKKVTSKDSKASTSSIETVRSAVGAITNALHAAKYFVWAPVPQPLPEDYRGWSGWSARVYTDYYGGKNPFRRRERYKSKITCKHKDNLTPVQYRFLKHQARFRESMIARSPMNRTPVKRLPKHRRARDMWLDITGKPKVEYTRRPAFSVRAEKGRNYPKRIKMTRAYRY